LSQPFLLPLLSPGVEGFVGLVVGGAATGCPSGDQVFAINPLAAARYRDRHHVSGAKSDAGEAKLLADLVRTDRRNHRRVAGDSPESEAVKVLARAHQNLIWTRNRHTNALRSALREYYPGALEAFDDLHDRDALAVLGRASTPAQAANLSLSKIRSALKGAGRQHNLDTRAQEIQTALRTEQLAAPAAVTAAFAAATRATVGIIAELNRQITDLTRQDRTQLLQSVAFTPGTGGDSGQDQESGRSHRGNGRRVRPRRRPNSLGHQRFQVMGVQETLQARLSQPWTNNTGADLADSGTGSH
jgi:hypothetical protein